LSRLTPLDKALAWILVPLWVVVFALSVGTQVGGGGLAMVALSVEDAVSYPALTGEYASYLHPSDPLAAAGLKAGDRVIRVGDADLRGADTFTFFARIREESGPHLSVPLFFERHGEHNETSLAVRPLPTFLPGLAASLAFAASAVFLILRARPTPTVRAWFYFGMCIAFTTCLMLGSRFQFYATLGMVIAASSVTFPLLFNFLFRFPDDRPPAGRWHRIWPWFLGVPHGLFFLLSNTTRMALGQMGMTATTTLGLLAALAVATGKYRRVDPIARRQMKWVVLGVNCVALTMAVAVGAAALDPHLSWLWFASFGALPLLPLSLVISVVRFNLFDIDRLLSAAASYNILLVLLGAGALVVVPRVAEALSGVAGVDPGTSQIVLSLLLAGVVVPAHRRLRPQIDRVFFKDRYALDRGIAELLPILSQCADAKSLTERVGQGLNRLLRPEACVVYSRVEQSYAPVFVEGRAVPPAFAAGSSLIVALQERGALLALGDAGRRPDEAALSPFDRAALETLQAEVILPVRRQDDAIAAFLCLGPKQSGDVYTPTDLSLLAAVAETVFQRLQHFDQNDVIREGRAMQESLRSYVPGAIADQLSSGAELTSGEREVTVLFVDIRGYTSFSEGRKAEEIFSTVNQYTEAVSQIVQKHAGSVVEFSGDGMMAVFGAPKELAHKERAAVEAGYEIVDAVGALEVEDATGGQTKLSVGVGIATGEAFVGNIQAVDRMIWTAIGNTTNLAARLQSLTRELDASLVIDHATWEKAQPAAAGFDKRPDVPIRGRRATQDLYVLAMPAAS
jgi:class 3 adenylate cyclase